MEGGTGRSFVGSSGYSGEVVEKRLKDRVKDMDNVR